MIFYGIADAHGLETFQPSSFENEIQGFAIDPKILGMMSLRAQANRHRHAVVYQVDVEREIAEEVLDLIEQGKNDEALIKLKEEATEILLMKQPGAEKSWKMIPNPDLDPYH